MTERSKIVLKVSFSLLIIGATILVIAANTSFLPTEVVPAAFGCMFIGAAIMAVFYKPRKKETDVTVYHCAKCGKQLTHSEVWLLGGRNIPENRVCQPCFKLANQKKKGPN